ncbi:MAG: amino acid adenylation domain-containing protein, partial [Methanobrevibacter sp.]|nr:amino acid adenylation domain-containing protein [Methanobrevibacter sp.]
MKNIDNSSNNINKNNNNNNNNNSNSNINSNHINRNINRNINNHNDDIEEDSFFPLTNSQLGLYFEILEDPNSLMYNIPFIIKFNKSNKSNNFNNADSSNNLNSNLNPENLKNAIIEVIKKHSYLNVRFVNKNGNIYQKPCYFDGNIEIAIFNEKYTDSSIKSFIRPFDLFNDKLYRFEIYEDKENIFLLADIHHIIFDGFCADLLIDDLLRYLNNEEIKEETVTFFDLAKEKEKNNLNSGYSNNNNSNVYKESHDFYSNKLDYFEGQSSIPINKEDNESNKSNSNKGIEKSKQLNFDLNKIESLSNELKLSPNILFLGAFNLALNKFLYDKDLIISTIANERTNKQYAKYRNSMGMMVNTFALILNTDSNLNIKDYLFYIKNSFHEYLKHQNYSLMDLKRDFNIKSNISYVYQGSLIRNRENVSFEKLDLETPIDPFSFNIWQEENSFSLIVKYDSSLYNDEFVNSFLNSLVTILNSFIHDKNQLIKDISIIPKEVNYSIRDFGGKLPHELFKEQVKEHGQEIALISSDYGDIQELSYLDLDKQSDIIAGNLIDRGVEIEDKVVISLNRNSNLIATILGIIKVGACFIPIDPHYPEERINYIISNSESKFIITENDVKFEGSNEESATRDFNHISIDELTEQGENNLDSNFKDALNLVSDKIAEDDLIYMIYTSGSTGNPKGVMVTQGSIANFIYPFDDNIEAIAIKEASRVLSTTTVSFDPFYQEIFTSLFNGLTLILANEKEAKNPLELVNLFKKTNFETFAVTPSILLQYLSVSEFDEVLNNIDSVIVGGEAFSDDLYDKLKKYPNLKVYNSYGPTETTISCNSKILEDEIVIGKPMYNVEERIADIDGNFIPDGAIGELLIGGYGVGRGYWKFDDLTHEKFIEIDNCKFFKSGDLAIRKFNGDYKIIGRIDNQVKLRGQRVETEEIESLINENEYVDMSFVNVNEIDSNDYLTAYIKINNKSTAIL